MEATTTVLEALLPEVKGYMLALSVDSLTTARAPGKWSKKEILGHLVDSAINNLKRFTEVQLEPSPYQVKVYNQAGLVKVNGYQEKDTESLIELWTALNRQIIRVLDMMPDQVLIQPIITPEGDTKSVQWLAEDYLVHMQHHLHQIKPDGF